MIKIFESNNSIDYLNPNTELNSSNFNKEDLFESIYGVLFNLGIPLDDFKGNISYQEYEGFSDIEGEFNVRCSFEWIFYNEEVPIKKFKKVSDDIESQLRKSFTNIDDCDCVRYTGNSQYSDNGYDVSLEMSLSYPLKED